MNDLAATPDSDAPADDFKSRYNGLMSAHQKALAENRALKQKMGTGPAPDDPAELTGHDKDGYFAQVVAEQPDQLAEPEEKPVADAPDPLAAFLSQLDPDDLYELDSDGQLVRADPPPRGYRQPPPPGNWPENRAVNGGDDGSPEWAYDQISKAPAKGRWPF